MMNPPSVGTSIPAARPRAFTLVELLVVIGIIALLIGILVPVLGNARQSAQRTTCAAQLRDIASLFQMYLNDHKQRVPRVNPLPSLPDFLGYPAPGLVEVLEPYHRGATGVFRCPSDRIINPSSDPRLASFTTYFEREGTSYEYNVFFNAFAVIDKETGINKVWGAAIADSAERGIPAERLPVVHDMDPFHHKEKANPLAKNCLYADWHVAAYEMPRRNR